MREFTETLDGLRREPTVADPDIAAALKRATPARIAVGRAGARPKTADLLRFRADHAAARDTIRNEVSSELLDRHDCIRVASAARDVEEYLLRPDLGRRVRNEDVPVLRETGPHGAEVLLMVGDGLSANAVEANLDDMVPALQNGLTRHGLTLSRPVFVRRARVGVMNHVGEILEPEAVILLIGERSGLVTDESMSAYLCYRPRPGSTDADRNVVSNIHRGGIPTLEAGSVVADMIQEYLDRKASGVKLRG